ncbi:MAG TPA: inositol monophosphatase family protein [Candidatus Dojkabacteria bacterium]|jgi:fructose-1,6-bisphosphatase/inositol monophosphatase family enzyme
MDYQEFLQKIDHSGYLKESEILLNDFPKIAMQIPKFRTDRDLMKSTVKSASPDGRQDLVTEADKYVQKLVQEFIPTNWGIWGEENLNNLKEGHKFSLYIDPIEGTNNFVNFKDENWGSVIALVDNVSQEPVVGIIAHPAKSKLYFGIKESGAYIIGLDRNGGILNVKDIMDLSPIDKFTYNNSPHFSKKLNERVEVFKSRGERKNEELVIKDQNFIDLESGALEAMQYRGGIFFKTSLEMAAVQVILEELGGLVTDFEGKRWHRNFSSMIFARNRVDYEFLLSLI